jgi:VIT1/CCC1 family predicted Fe2+/Mn2+ transporter
MSLVRLVPWIVHSAVEYAVAVLFLLAPFLFGFDSETAKWTSIAFGSYCSSRSLVGASWA